MIKTLTASKNALILFIATILVCTLFVQALATPKAKAVSASDWKPGRIIDDAVYLNKDSMNTQQIQAFLNSKVPVCDTWQKWSGWYKGYWNAAPYTCLKDYSENGKSSAQIIWEAAQNYRINPQLLLVTLQKETSMITDTWAATWQYKRAVGYRCPDSKLGTDVDANQNGCYDSHENFTAQINGAAFRLRDYMDNPTGYNHRAGTTRYIAWTDKAGCGGTDVYLENQATAALYNYTPYQPNQAALNNMYGLGDACSSYGNRNFWSMFNDWFGASTPSALFGAQLVYQSNYPTISAGQTVEVILSYKNTGLMYWRDSRTAASYGQFPIHLVTANEPNRKSWFGSSWPNSARPALTFNRVYDITPNGVKFASDQTVVNPGQIAEYIFKFTATSDTPSSVYREAFFPAREGTSAWFMGGLSWLDLTIRPTNYNPTYYRQSPYPNLRAGESTAAFFDIKNNGNTTWYDEQSRPAGIKPLRLATYKPINKSSIFSAKWNDKTRPVINFSKVYESDGNTIAQNQHTAQPGQIVRFEFEYTIPNDTPPGIYREYFTPILEGAPNWNIGGALWHDITVYDDRHKPSFVNQSDYPTVAKGASKNVFFKLKNNGSSALYDKTAAPNGIYPMHLATTVPINRNSPFGKNWTSNDRPALNFAAVYEPDGVTLAANQHIAQPGQIVLYSFDIIVPLDIKSGIYREYFTPILEGAPNWNIGETMWLDITIP